jgi:hypothetical protein
MTMSNEPNLAAETLVGLPPEAVYKTIITVLPDGKEFPQLFQLVRLPDGTEEWQLTTERIRAFDEAFANATTVPNNWKETDTELLTRRPSARETEATVRNGGVTRIDLRRVLVLNLGDPQAIIQQKGLDTDRQRRFDRDKAFFTTLVMMARSHGGEWSEAAKFLHPAYPEILS